LTWPVVHNAVPTPNATQAGGKIKNGIRIGPKMYLA
jgi:hypothetical protein